MPLVRAASFLTNVFPLPNECHIPGQSVAEVVQGLELQFPGVKRYLLDDQGALRVHVNIFLGSQLLQDRQHLSDPVNEASEVYLMQALSGG
jgi:hypothetical protein